MATLMEPEPTKTGNRRLVLKVCLDLFWMVVTLIALEAGSYLFGSFAGPDQPVRGGNISIYGQHDQDLFWSLRPFAEAKNGERWINSDGLRGPEIPAKREGEYRILNIGESTTFAAHVDYEQCYSALLETLLNREREGDPVRVLNAGVPGYSMFQGVEFLRQRGLEFEPDLVTLYFGYTDYLSVAYLGQRAGDEDSSESGLTDRQLFELRSSTTMRLTSFLTRHSNLLRGIRQTITRNSEAKPVARVKSARVPREDRRFKLKQAREFCEQYGIQLVVIVPIYRKFNAHVGFLRKYIRENSLTGVDLPATLPARFTKPETAYFIDTVHPNPEGHLLIAEAIHEVISPLIR